MSRTHLNERRQLLLFDGFENVANATTVRRRYGMSAPDAAALQWINGRKGYGTALRWPSAGATTLTITLRDAFPADPHVVGFAWRASAVPDGSVWQLIAFRDSGTVQASVYVLGTPSGVVLQVRRSTGSVLTTTPEPLQAGRWYWIEFRLRVADSGGEFELRLAQATVLSGRADTQSTGTSNVNSIVVTLTNPGGGGTTDIDDLYIVAPQRPWLSDSLFLGELTSSPVAPTADGSLIELSPVGLSENWDCVAETVPDDGATMVVGAPALVGDILTDRYVLAPLDRTRIAGRVLGAGVVCEDSEASAASPRAQSAAALWDPASASEVKSGPAPMPQPTFGEIYQAFGVTPAGVPFEQQDPARLEAGPVIHGTA